MNKKNLLKSLQLLDLSRHGGEVFLSLLELGPSNAGPIIKQTGLHRQFVYSALEQLKERGLVSYVIRGGRRVFEAAPPEHLVNLQRERETLAQALIPELHALSFKTADRLSVETRTGVSEFRQSLITSLEEAAKGDGILRVIGGGNDETFYNAIGDFYETYLKVGQKLQIKKHLIAPAQSESRFQKVFAAEKGTELRFSKYLSSPTYTRITPTLTTLEIYKDDPTIIQIWNRSIAQAHKEHFEMLWNKL